MTFWISALLFVAGVGTGLRRWSQRVRRAAAARQRRVERPNSHYAAPGVRRLVDLERWKRIPLRRLHPVNRQEADRLLRQANTTGPDSLTRAERLFLDNMTPQE